MDSSAEPVPFELVTKSTLMPASAQLSKSDALGYQIITNAQDWSRYWVTVSEDSVPRVRFDDEFVLCVYQGTKPTGGYEIAVGEVRLDGNALRVALELRQPDPGAMLIQVITNPYAIYKVELPQAARGHSKPSELQIQFVQRTGDGDSKLQVRRLDFP